tara:strand:+ start:449 stop:829 length:381 start_codon:yes stop_codon:yes gene_type:complete
LAKLLGAENMRRKIAKLAAAVPNKVGIALYSEALIEQAESMVRTPVDTGALRASHITTQPERSAGGGTISVTIQVGGPAADYALQVHEDMEALHKTGQAKFLESTINESAPHLAARIGARLKSDLF